MKEEYIQLYIEAQKEYNFGFSVITTKMIEHVLLSNTEHSTADALKLLSLHHPASQTSYIRIEDDDGGFAERIIRIYADLKRGDKDIRQYLLVNGHIPLTPENLQGIDGYISANSIPVELTAKLLKIAEDEVGDYQEEVETGNFGEVKGVRLDGAWFENGIVENFKVKRTRHIEVITDYTITLEEEVDESLLQRADDGHHGEHYEAEGGS